MLLELALQFCNATLACLNGSHIRSLRVISNVVRSGFQSAQLQLTLPRFAVVGKERVIHFAVLFDRIPLRKIIAVGVKIKKRSLREHFLVVNADPFFPVGVLFPGQVYSLELWSWIGPYKFCARHATCADG